MRHLLAAALLLGLAAPAQAATARDVLGRLLPGQISFDGLDLSDDQPKKKPAKNKDKKKGKGNQSSPSAPPADRAPPSSGSSDYGSSSSSSGGDSTGLDLSGPSTPPSRPSGGTATKTKPSSNKPSAAPMMSFDAVDVSGKSAERQRLDAAIKIFKEDGFEAAALAFQDVYQDPKMADLADESLYMLGKSLYKMGLYHSALNQFKAVLSRGANGKFFKSALEWLFYIADKTVNEQIVLEEVARYANFDFPERFRSQFRYLLARYHFVRGKALDEAGQGEEAKKSFEEARKLVLQVPRGDRFYGKVKYLQGTIDFKEGAFPQALESFKEVVRANNPRGGYADAHQRALAFMQLARTHYGHKQNRYAIFYYDKVERGSDQWLEALFESSWAHFRIGQYERALGNLITLSSPFFKDEYFPEALILKAVVYFENCRYKEARAILEEFEQTYMPVHNELEKITAQKSDSQGYWDMLAEIQRRNVESGGRGSTVLLERIFKLALSDKDLKAANDSILEVEKEQDTIGGLGDRFRYSDLAKSLNEGLKAERAALAQKAGVLAKSKLENELTQLKDLLGQALRIKFETTDMEKRALEDELAGGPKLVQLKNYKFSCAVGDERECWPYEGEYWRDELGTYEYTLTKGCKGK